MIERQPYLPRFMAGGEGNPLGARALYLGKTLVPDSRHQSAHPDDRLIRVLGLYPSHHEDVADLYQRVQVGRALSCYRGRSARDRRARGRYQCQQQPLPSAGAAATVDQVRLAAGNG